MSTLFEMDCGGETVTIEKTDDGDFIFHGYDEDAELAAIELGFEPSPCWIVWTAINNDELNYVLLDQVMLDHASEVEALIFVGADVEASGSENWKPLHTTAFNNSIKTAKTLIESGAHVDAKDEDGWTPLHAAVSRGHADLAKTLIGAGANVDASTNLKNTPLHLLADNGRHPDIARLLLKAVANFNAENHLGYTPLQTAEQYQSKGVATIINDWILEHGE